MAAVAGLLHTQLAAVAPIISVSIPDLNNKPGWVITYDVTATPAQKTAAQNVINTFDVTAEDTRLSTLTNDPNVIALKNTLRTSTSAQIISYVDAQVPELSVNARAMLKKMLAIMAASI